MRASITSDEDEEDDTHIRNSCSQRKGARAEEVVYVECSNFELTDGLTFPQQQTCAPPPPRERPRSAAAREILKFGKSVIKTSSAIPGGARLVSTLHRSLFYVTSFCWNTLTVVPLLLPPDHSPSRGSPRTSFTFERSALSCGVEAAARAANSIRIIDVFLGRPQLSSPML